MPVRPNLRAWCGLRRCLCFLSCSGKKANPAGNNKKRPPHFCGGFVFALSIFPGSHPKSWSTYMSLTSVFGMAASLSAAGGRISEGAACAAVGNTHACFVRQCGCRAPQTETGGPSPVPIYKRKTSTLRLRFLVFALSIFPGSHPPSIVDVHELNFCVRDGNRWTLMTINTNYVDGFPHLLYQSTLLCSNNLGDPYRIRTDVNGVRGRCLNHLTNGPLVHLQGLEPGTH